MNNIIHDKNKSSEDLATASASNRTGEMPASDKRIIDQQYTTRSPNRSPNRSPHPRTSNSPKRSSSQSRGVNHHSHSVENLQKMLDEASIAPHQHYLYAPTSSTQHMPQTLHPIHNRNNNNYGHDNLNDSYDNTIQEPEEEEYGWTFFDSTKKWLDDQRARRQQQQLQKEVEEQRRILYMETQKILLKQHQQHQQHCESLQREEEERKREWEKKYEHTLNDNPTFQAMTNQHSHDDPKGSILGNVPLCGNYAEVIEDEESYASGKIQYDLEEDGDDDQSFADYKTAMQTQSNLDFDTIDSTLSMGMMTADNGISQEEQDAFRIRTPCFTNGGGLTVQLEFLNKNTGPMSKKGAKRIESSSGEITKDGEKQVISAKSQSNMKQSSKDEDRAISNAKPTVCIDTQNSVKIVEEAETVLENVPYLLTREQMNYLSENALPPSIMFSKWKRLYSLQRDGDSFSSAFLKMVQGHTRTLLVIETTKNEIMGAYVNSSWESQGIGGSAQFYGSAQACLFSISKDTGEVKVFKWSGKNRYIQVCDIHHKLIALGGGGEEGEFGLCVEDDFRCGSTGNCDTFDNEQLCTEGQFEIVNVECWGFISGVF